VGIKLQCSVVMVVVIEVLVVVVVVAQVVSGTNKFDSGLSCSRTPSFTDLMYLSELHTS